MESECFISCYLIWNLLASSVCPPIIVQRPIVRQPRFWRWFRLGRIDLLQSLDFGRTVRFISYIWTLALASITPALLRYMRGRCGGIDPSLILLNNTSLFVIFSAPSSMRCMGRVLRTNCAVIYLLFRTEVRQHPVLFGDFPLSYQARQDACERCFRRAATAGQSRVIAGDGRIGFVDKAKYGNVDSALCWR